jgi:hypothetical protein
VGIWGVVIIVIVIVTSLKAFEPESFVQLLVDSIAYRNNVCSIDSFDLALDVCLKAIHIIPDKKQDAKQQMMNAA